MTRHRRSTKKKARSDTSSKARKVIRKKRVTRKRAAPKTRNAGTMTESQFFGKIRSALRRAFRFWKPITDAAERASRPYVGPNKRQKKEYQCNHCKKWFMRKNVQVDHVEECGSLMKYDDLVPFITRLTKEDPSDYQVLCKKCHTVKTKEYLKQKT